MKKREIELDRLPPVPLTPEAILKLTELCFRADDPLPAQVQVLFIFGSSHSLIELKQAMKRLVSQLRFDSLVITGGIDLYADSAKQNTAQALVIFEMIKDLIPSEVKVYLESDSKNTLENVIQGVALLPKPIQSLCCLVKSFHSRRAYLTLQKQLPAVPLFQFSFDVSYPETKMILSSKTWIRDKKFIARVWGDFLRIKLYGERGDISYPPEIRASVEELYKILKL